LFSITVIVAVPAVPTCKVLLVTSIDIDLVIEGEHFHEQEEVINGNVHNTPPIKVRIVIFLIYFDFFSILLFKLYNNYNLTINN
jgi:hypothetical protein